MNRSKLTLCCALFTTNCIAELNPLDDSFLDNISGQSGLTLNAKINLGDESRFVYTNTSGKALGEASSDDISYLVVDKIAGSIEFKGLALDLVSDLNSSGKAALQWTMPKEIEAKEFRTSGVYASDTKDIDTPTNVPNSPSTFLFSVEMDGTLQLPANTQLSVFVTD